MEWTDDFLTGGSGPALILQHGWPFHNRTFRKITPALSEHFTWYAPNALGMNAAGCPPGTDFSFEAHAARLLEFADARGIEKFSVLAHNTGGTAARIAAAAAPDRIQNLVILNTEIPGHRPPFIPLYRQLSRLPGSHPVFKFIFSKAIFLKSSAGFGGSFYDMSAMDAEFIQLFVEHWMSSKSRRSGLFEYLQGINFSAVDNLVNTHQQIRCPVHFIWGEDDPTFPIDLARNMAAKISTCASFTAVKHARFLPHEEQPEAVSRAIIEALCR